MSDSARTQVWPFIRLRPSDVERWCAELECKFLKPWLLIYAHMLVDKRNKPPCAYSEKAWHRISGCANTGHRLRVKAALCGLGYLEETCDGLTAPLAEEEWRFRDQRSRQQSRNSRGRGKGQEDMSLVVPRHVPASQALRDSEVVRATSVDAKSLLNERFHGLERHSNDH